MLDSSSRAFAACVALLSLTSSAAPALRVSVDQHGDFLLVGNTFGFECASGTPAPVVGTVASGDCSASTVGDTAPDLYWRSEEPVGGQALASTATTMATARSTATLTLPPGATVTHAYLYWGATRGSPGADAQVTLDRPNGFLADVTALATFTSVNDTYLGVADVTALVQANGTGGYRVSGVTQAPLVDVNDDNLFGGWALVVFYARASDPLRNLALFDGLDAVTMGASQTTTVSGFLVPPSGYTGRLGVLAFEGDATTAGDSLFFNGGLLADAQNPGGNVFNSTRSTLGSAISVAGDLPQLTGTAQSMAGIDLDVFDVTPQLTPLQTSAIMQATATVDGFYLAAFVTSVSTFRPDFTTTRKVVTVVDGGSAIPGSELQYSVEVTNTGNDVATGATLVDVLPAGVTYVPGSLQVTSGPNAGSKTDASGDDQGEHDAASNTLTVRLGGGANAATGGILTQGATTTVTFRVTIAAGFSGSLSNQAQVAAAGQLGGPFATTLSDGAPGTTGQQATTLLVDQCLDDSLCSGLTPYCDTMSSPKHCISCLSNADCSGATPTCDPSSHACVGCTADLDCGGATSGLLCQSSLCQAGCSVTRNDCGAQQWCSVRDGGVGQCEQQCASDGECTSSPLSHCNVGGAPAFCVQCTTDGQCATGSICSPTKTCVECSSANTSLCSASMNGAACVSNACGCVSDADCGGTTSGRVCDATMQKCAVGCRGMSGNACPMGQQCSSSTGAPGTCIASADGGSATDAGTDVDAGAPQGGGGGSMAGGGSAATGGGATGGGATGGSSGTGGGQPAMAPGCGCASTDAGWLLVALGALLVRRSQNTRNTPALAARTR